MRTFSYMPFFLSGLLLLFFPLLLVRLAFPNGTITSPWPRRRGGFFCGGVWFFFLGCGVCLFFFFFFFFFGLCCFVVFFFLFWGVGLVGGFFCFCWGWFFFCFVHFLLIIPFSRSRSHFLSGMQSRRAGIALDKVRYEEKCWFFHPFQGFTLW